MIYKKKAVIVVTAVTGIPIDKNDVVLTSIAFGCTHPRRTSGQIPETLKNNRK